MNIFKQVQEQYGGNTCETIIKIGEKIEVLYSELGKSYFEKNHDSGETEFSDIISQINTLISALAEFEESQKEKAIIQPEISPVVKVIEEFPAVIDISVTEEKLELEEVSEPEEIVEPLMGEVSEIDAVTAQAEALVTENDTANSDTYTPILTFDKPEISEAPVIEKPIISEVPSMVSSIIKEETQVEARICSACQFTLGEEDLFCMSCGKKYVEPEIIEPVVEEEVATKHACPTCKGEIDAEDIFCSNCGFDLRKLKEVPENTAKTCKSCSFELGDDDIFCMKCGTKV